jgi:hypothetical protein
MCDTKAYVYEYAFYGNTSLEKIHFSNRENVDDNLGFSKIYSKAFHRCKNLQKFVLTKDFEVFGSAFEECSGLRDLYIKDLVSFFNAYFNGDCELGLLTNYTNLHVGNDLLVGLGFKKDNEKISVIPTFESKLDWPVIEYEISTTEAKLPPYIF